jgi:hypothetical protein
MKHPYGTIGGDCQYDAFWVQGLDVRRFTENIGNREQSTRILRAFTKKIVHKSTAVVIYWLYSNHHPMGSAGYGNHRANRNSAIRTPGGAGERVFQGNPL